MNVLMESLMKNRGWDDDFFQEIETASQHRMKNIDKLASLLKECHDEQKQIVILPDFDMDGIMSGTLGFAGLAELGFCVSLFIPDQGRGYGFDKTDIDRLMSEYPNTKVILTCDVGSTCYEGIAYAVSLGLEVYVTDHHQVDVVPAGATVLVNPMQMGDDYEHPGICGAYVLQQCLQCYADSYGTFHDQEVIRRLRIFAGIGTISDSMPLLYENRTLVRDAVNICKLMYAEGDQSVINGMGTCPVYTRAFQGLYHVLSLFHSLGKILTPERIDETFFAYYMAPVFNSLKRLNVDVRVAFDVFFGPDPAGSIAQMNALNEQRKVIVEQYLMQIKSQSNVYTPYVYVTDAPAGVLGLLAMKLMLETGMPTFVIRTDGSGYRGSARAPEWMPMQEYLKASGLDGVSVAGHSQAFGIAIDDDAALEDLFLKLALEIPHVHDEAVKCMTEEKYDFIISPYDDGDVWLDFSVLREYVYMRDKLRPFGQNIPAPCGCLECDAEDVVFKHVGSVKQHLTMTLPYGFKVFCPNQAGQEPKSGRIRIVGDLNLNTYRDVESVEFFGKLLV